MKWENFEGQLYTTRTPEVTTASQTSTSGNKWFESKSGILSYHKKIEACIRQLECVFLFVFKTVDDTSSNQVS